MALIKVQNLTKEFKIKKREQGLAGSIKGLFSNDFEIKKAVDNISFNIDKGEIVGYIGPNGAGKSTTIKMMVGILFPTSGSINANGVIPYKNRIENAKKIGVVFGQRTQLWWDIPVIETLNLMRYMYKIPTKQYNENLNVFSDILDINKFINTPVRQLSLGQRMRADLCAAMMHNPDILYLDEPTIGLDVIVKDKIREFIKEINKIRRTTVIITTHDMSDIEKLCSRVMLIDNGKIMYDGGIERIKDEYGSQESLVVETENTINDTSFLNELNLMDISKEDRKIFIKFDKKEVNSAAIIERMMEKSKVLDFTVKDVEIEEIVRRMYKAQQNIINE